MDQEKRKTARSLLHNILVRKISVFRVNIKQAKLQKRGNEHLHKTFFWEVYSYRIDHSERVDCIFNMKIKHIPL